MFDIISTILFSSSEVISGNLPTVVCKDDALVLRAGDILSDFPLVGCVLHGALPARPDRSQR